MYDVHHGFIGKRVVDFLLVIIELSSHFVPIRAFVRRTDTFLVANPRWHSIPCSAVKSSLG